MIMVIIKKNFRRKVFAGLTIMYVCVCKAITDNQLVQAIDQGASTRRQLMQCTGAGGVCGKCALSMKRLLDEHAAGRENQLQAA